MLNLERAIYTSTNKINSSYGHNSSNQMVVPNLLLNNFKENLNPNLQGTSKLLEHNSSVQCLTERNHQHKSNAQIQLSALKQKKLILGLRPKLKVNNFLDSSSSANQTKIFKFNKGKLNISKENLKRIRSLKDKTRAMCRQSSYHSMSEEPTLNFNSSKDIKLS